MKIIILSLMTHGTCLAVGFFAGVYLLPILTAPPAPSNTAVQNIAGQAEFTAEFSPDLAGSDFLHWGEGTLSVGRQFISLQGEVSPGPDYKLYLSPAFVETEAEFIELKPSMALVGDIKTFENFLIAVPESINPADYKAAIIWCEAFSEFITAASYR